MSSFDLGKAVNIVSFITYSSVPDIDIDRTIFVADVLHLKKYGRLLCGNTYEIKGGEILPVELFDKSDDYEIPFIPDINYLSESDLESLDEAISNLENYDEFHDTILADNSEGTLSIEKIIMQLDGNLSLISHYNETKNIDMELAVKITNLMAANPEDYQIIFKTFVMTLEVQMYSNKQINKMTNIVSNEFIKKHQQSVNFFNKLKKDIV